MPPNRALSVQPQSPVRAGLDAVYQWASLTRMHQSGEATRGSHPDQVAAVVLTASMFWAPSPFGTSFVPRDGWSHAVVVSG